MQVSTLNSTVSSTIAGHILSSVDDSLTLSGVSGNLVVTQLNASVMVCDAGLSVQTLIPATGVNGNIDLMGQLDIHDGSLLRLNQLSTTASGFGTAGQTLHVDQYGGCYWGDDLNSDVSQWASYVASQDVDINDKDLKKVNKLSTTTNGTGSEGQVLKTDVNGVCYWGDDKNDVSQWSSFSAVSSVNMDGNSITNVDIVDQFNCNIVNESDVEQKINLSYGASTVEPQIPALIINNPTSQYGYVTVNGNIECNNSISSVKVLAYDPLDLYSAGMCQMSISGGLGLLQSDIILPKKRNDKIIYCSNNTEFLLGNGSILAPYKTIQQALDYINLNYDGTYYYIQLMNGTYTENITITKKCYIRGLGKSVFEDGVGCCITGTVTVNVPTTGDLFNTCVNISGVLINGYIDNISEGDVCLNLSNVYIYSANQSVIHNPVLTSRLRITDSMLNSQNGSSVLPLLDVRSGASLTMNNVIINAKGLQSCIKLSGTAVCDTITNCKFECSNVGAMVLPIVLITATVSGIYTFQNCGFIYSSTTGKSSNVNACGIMSSPASGNPRIVILYCSFFLFGTSDPTNYAVNDANAGTATAMACLYYMNNASLSNAFSINAVQNVNKFQLQVVS
jgi:hypothetical protein